MCTGNTGREPRYTCDVYGLSLCIQGTLKLTFARIIRERFIPVYTGNTIYEFGYDLVDTVYPCVYREHFIE